MEVCYCVATEGQPSVSKCRPSVNHWSPQSLSPLLPSSPVTEYRVTTDVRHKDSNRPEVVWIQSHTAMDPSDLAKWYCRRNKNQNTSWIGDGTYVEKRNQMLHHFGKTTLDFIPAEQWPRNLFQRYHIILGDRPQFGESPPNKITATSGKNRSLCPKENKKVIVCLPCPDGHSKTPAINKCPALKILPMSECLPCPEGHSKTPALNKCPALKILPMSECCPNQKNYIQKCTSPCPGAPKQENIGDCCPKSQDDECPKIAKCSPCSNGDAYSIAKDFCAYKLKANSRQRDYLYRCESRELIGSKLLKYCLCVRRNGLQDDCPRTPCQGRPACLIRPWPDCWPSGGCHGIDYERQNGIQRVNPSLQYRMDNKECGPGNNDC